MIIILEWNPRNKVIVKENMSFLGLSDSNFKWLSGRPDNLHFQQETMKDSVSPQLSNFSNIIELLLH